MSNMQTTLLQALAADPGDDTAWLALADYLEEQDQADRAELMRLNRALRTPSSPQRDSDERRLQE